MFFLGYFFPDRLRDNVAELRALLQARAMACGAHPIYAPSACWYCDVRTSCADHAHCSECICRSLPLESTVKQCAMYDVLEQYMSGRGYLPVDYTRPGVYYNDLRMPLNLLSCGAAMVERFARGVSRWCGASDSSVRTCVGRPCHTCLLCSSPLGEGDTTVARRRRFSEYAAALGFTCSPDTQTATGASSEPAPPPDEQVQLVGGSVVRQALLPTGPIPRGLPSGDWAERLRRYNAGLTCWCEDSPKCIGADMQCSHCLLSSKNKDAVRLFGEWAKLQGWEVTRNDVKDTFVLPPPKVKIRVNFIDGTSEFSNPRIMPTLIPGDYLRFDSTIEFAGRRRTHMARYLGYDSSHRLHMMMAVGAVNVGSAAFYDPINIPSEGVCMAEHYIWKLMDSAADDDPDDYRFGRPHICQVIRLTEYAKTRCNAEALVRELAHPDAQPRMFRVWNRPY